MSVMSLLSISPIKFQLLALTGLTPSLKRKTQRFLYSTLYKLYRLLAGYSSTFLVSYMSMRETTEIVASDSIGKTGPRVHYTTKLSVLCPLLNGISFET